MPRIRHIEAALLPRPPVGWPRNVPVAGISPYPSRIQFVQTDPAFPRFKHATVESMSGNGRPARAAREKGQSVERSSGPTGKVQRQPVNIKFQDWRPATRESRSACGPTKQRVAIVRDDQRKEGCQPERRPTNVEFQEWQSGTRRSGSSSRPTKRKAAIACEKQRKRRYRRRFSTKPGEAEVEIECSRRANKTPTPTVDNDHLRSQAAVRELLRDQEEEFETRLKESEARQWCDRVPQDLILTSVQSFYQDLHSRTALPTDHCRLCQQMTAPDDLRQQPWQGLLRKGSAIRALAEAAGALECRECFHPSPKASTSFCSNCRKAAVEGSVPRACAVNNLAIGCHHRYPQELRDLSPMEERLIALAQPYGWVTKIEISVERKTNGDYRKLKKGHITIFPNNLESLVSNVLPAPIIQHKESLHVCFIGPRQPLPRDLSFLLRVRPANVRRALLWLKGHNPLYGQIEISTQNLEQYADAVDEIPRALLGDMEQYVPNAQDVIQTGHYVPSAERGESDSRDISIGDIMDSLRATDKAATGNDPTGDMEDDIDLEADAEVRIQEEIGEITSSGMMAVDIPPQATAFEKLEHLSRAICIRREIRKGSPWTKGRSRSSLFPWTGIRNHSLPTDVGTTSKTHLRLTFSLGSSRVSSRGGKGGRGIWRAAAWLQEMRRNETLP